MKPAVPLPNSEFRIPNSFLLPPLSVILFLVLAVGAVYWPACHYDFVNYDDPRYVSQNDYVRHGFTRDGLVQAIEGVTVSNWHPLTMLSHMAVCEFVGVHRPGWHHAVNIALHAAASVLLFLALLRMTVARWPAAAVAALFALHPLHVESVAWVAERKDVLRLFSGCSPCWPMSITRQPTAGRYLVVFLMLTLGLMSKPMLVTLPLVLLLLDYWPLGRFGAASGGGWFFGPPADLPRGGARPSRGLPAGRGAGPRAGAARALPLFPGTSSP